MSTKPASTREWLLAKIEEFLTNNPAMRPESFGWACIGDSTLVDRLRKGGDVYTRQLDRIIAYLANPK